ncbi:hypothetical protein [Aeromonas media]|uniref:hypothetical protein n=1 Tax=Aeromonas media TaxID=651 RepID=UPI0018757DEA|nr:hypothetical protein [Aeromonas media]
MNQRTELRPRLRQQVKKKIEKPAKSPEHTLVLVQIALALLPLLTACIYLFGMARHMGYLSVFHVDSSEFPLSTEQNLLMGVLSLVSNVLPLIFYPIAVVIGLMALGTVVALTFRLIKKATEQARDYGARIGSSEPMIRFYKKVFKYSIEPHEAKWFEAIYDLIFTWYFRFLYVFVACAIVFGLAFVSYRDGEESANQQVEKMKQGPQDFAEHLIYAKHPEGVSAVRIACNAAQCTFWTEKDGTIYLRHDQIDGVTIPPITDEKAICSPLGKLDKLPSVRWTEWASTSTLSSSPPCIYIPQKQT